MTQIELLKGLYCALQVHDLSDFVARQVELFKASESLKPTH